MARQGVNGFYNSLEARLECCRIRKVEPFQRAIAGYAAWVTGVRREQSATAPAGNAVEWDAENGLYKVSPLLEWTEEQVWQYIRAAQLPYNPLHDRQFPSIGCSPCTRAISPARAAAPAAGGGSNPSRANAACSREFHAAALPV